MILVKAQLRSKQTGPGEDIPVRCAERRIDWADKIMMDLASQQRLLPDGRSPERHGGGRPSAVIAALTVTKPAVTSMGDQAARRKENADAPARLTAAPAFAEILRRKRGGVDHEVDPFSLQESHEAFNAASRQNARKPAGVGDPGPLASET